MAACLNKDLLQNQEPYVNTNVGPYFQELSGIKIPPKVSCLTTQGKIHAEEISNERPDCNLAPWEKWCLYFIRIGKFCQSLPLNCDTYRGVLVLHMTTNKLVLAMWYIRLLALIVDNIYLIIVSKYVALEEVGDKEFVNFWAHTISRAIASAIICAIGISWQGTVQIYNTLTLNTRNWKERYGAWSADFAGPLEKSLRRMEQLATVFFLVQPLFPLALHFENRQSARYWGSRFFPTKIYNSIFGIILFALYDFTISMFVIQNCGYAIFLITAYLVLMRFWTASIMENILKRFGNLICSTPLFQYRCLLGLTRIANCCIGTYLLPTTLVLGSFLACVLLSGLIRSGNGLPLIVVANMVMASILLIIGVHVVLDGGGRMFTRSQELKRLLKQDQNLYRRKYAMSLRDIRIHMGQFFYVTEGTFTDFMEFIRDQTITLIFAF